REGEEPRAGFAAGAGHGAAAQRRVDVDVAVRDHLRARVDRRGDDEVAAAGVDLLPGAQRPVDDERRQRSGDRGRLGLRRGPGRRGRRQPYARLWRRKEPGGGGGLEVHAPAFAHGDGHQSMALEQGDERREVDRRVERLEPRQVDHHGVAVEEVGNAAEALGKVALEGGKVGGLEEQRDERQVRALDLEAAGDGACQANGIAMAGVVLVLVVCAQLPGQTVLLLPPLRAASARGLFWDRRIIASRALRSSLARRRKLRGKLLPTVSWRRQVHPGVCAVTAKCRRARALRRSAAYAELRISSRKPAAQTPLAAVDDAAFNA